MKKQLLLSLGISLLVACGSAEPTENVSSTPTPTVEEEVLKLNGNEATILPDEKKETVYVDADAYGNPIKKTVNVTLKGITSNNYILDESILNDIINTEGDEEYYLYGNQIAWDNRQKDIQYKGTTDKDIPVSVKVTYYLDENEIDPKELIGKDGHVRIRFDYSNHTSESVMVNGQSYTTHIPFMMMTTAFLSKDSYSNINVKNGRLVEMGGQTIFVGLGFPSLEEDLQLYQYEATKEIEIPNYAEFEADVKDFSLDYTATIATTNYLEDLETQDLIDLEGTANDLNEAKDGINKLKDGTNALNDGLNEYKGGMDKYFEGVYNLCIAMDQYVEGFKKLNNNSSQLVNGSKTISDNLKKIKDNLDKIDTEAMKNILDPQTAALLNQVIQQLMVDVQTLSSDNSDVQQMIQEVETFLNDAKSYSDNVLAKKQEIEGALATIDSTQLASTINEEAKAQAKQLIQNALASTTLTDEEKQTILNSLDGIDISASLSSLNQSVSDIQNALGGMNELTIPTIDTQLESMNEAAQDLQTQLSILTNAIQGNAQLVGILTEIGSMIEELQKGISALSSGSTQLTKGISEYTGGVNTLYTAATKIQSGIGELWKASTAFDEGFTEVLKGVKEMKDGVNEFDSKAMNEINKYAGNELKNVIARLRAVKELDHQYTNYSGLVDGVKGSVYFVIETESLK